MSNNKTVLIIFFSSTDKLPFLLCLWILAKKFMQESIKSLSRVYSHDVFRKVYKVYIYTFRPLSNFLKFSLKLFLKNLKINRFYRNLIKMFASFNGYILRESATSETPQVTTFTIDFHKDNKDNIFFRDGATDTGLNIFKCSHLKKYICDKILDSNEANGVKLLKVSVNKEKIKEDFNENDIKNELKGTLMEYHKLFKGYFKDELARAD